MHFLELLNLIAGLIPVIHQTVLTVETLIPQAKAGAQKLDCATQIVASALPAIGATVQQIQAIKAATPGLINATVAAMNAGQTPAAPGA